MLTHSARDSAARRGNCCHAYSYDNIESFQSWTYDLLQDLARLDQSLNEELASEF